MVGQHYNVTVGVRQRPSSSVQLPHGWQLSREQEGGAEREREGNGGGVLDTLQLTAADEELDVRVSTPLNKSLYPATHLTAYNEEIHSSDQVFFDGHFAEVFFMGGRVAMTVAIPATKSAGFTMFADSAVSVSRAHAFHMNAIWASKSEVRPSDSAGTDSRL